MEEGFSRREKIVGLFFLVLVTLTNVSLIVISKGKGLFFFQRTYQVRLKEGYNLQPGSPVKMFAAEIGKVNKIEIDKKNIDFPVIVTINVLAEYADLITEDSEAEVVSPLFIGSVYLAITAGSPSYPKLANYGVIRTSQRRGLRESLQEFASEETLQRVKTTLTNLGQMAEQLKNDEKVVIAAVEAFRQVWTNLNEGKGTLGQLATKQDFYERLNQSADELGKVLMEAQKITADLKPAARNLQEIARTIKVEVETLNAILGNLKGGSAVFPELMETAAETVRGSKEVVEALKANPLIRLTSPRQPESQALHVEPRDAP
jgi:phospholipid/cholesterol/gamma-HCH transport system substrate-binding protein